VTDPGLGPAPACPARRRPTPALPLGRVLAAGLALFGATFAQDEQGPPAPDSLRVGNDQDPEGQIIRELVVEPPAAAEAVRRFLRSKEGGVLRAADIAFDHAELFRRLRVLSNSYTVQLDDGVRLILVIQESETFDRFEFRGLSKFSEREVRALLNLDARQRVNRLAAEQYAATLRERYRRRGHAFVQVRIVEDPDRSTLTFEVDEGPEVTVGTLQFIGNASFPGWAPIGFYDNLAGSARLQSQPGGKISGGDPYSPEVVDEDLDRLRLWYRQQGYRDARVELAGVVFAEDRRTVDLTILVDEGQRYRLASVDLVQIPAAGGGEPLYGKDEVLARVKMQTGDYYDYQRVEIDKRAISRFYGERGHPLDGQYGRGISNSFRIGDPREVVDPERAEVALTFVVEEGTPKQLRAVRVRGNTDTRSRVILRKVFQLPGETLDMTKVERSLGSLDALRYFQDPQTFGGVRFELLPVPGDPDVVDLGIDVTEGETGSFLWGAGVSTAFGVQGRFVLSKRNFDITRPPSNLNPIDWIGEIADNKAFHGAGQDLELMLAPGTEVSLFNLSFYEPDIFRTHFDTYGLRVEAYKRLQAFDSFFMDSLGGELGLQRNFTEELSVGLSVRQETVSVEDIDADAPTIVWDAEGRSEMRGLRLTLNLNDVDYALEPTDGYRFRAYGEVVGGPFGADEDFWKAGFGHTHYFPVYRDELDRAHVLRWKASFDYGKAFGDSEVLFLTERFYMGGNNLRGFDQRRAGPSQFGQPVGGEARLLTNLEYQFPLVSTRQQGQIRQTEVLRGVVFTDFGMLGLSIDELGPPRLSAGVGVRILVPVLNVPIALDLGWPILDETTDRQRQFFFTLSRF
jgi:outer membrane protein insertion porin family